MVIAERKILQPAFSRKLGIDEKGSVLSKKNLRDKIKNSSP
jgi:hypothetical protein